MNKQHFILSEVARRVGHKAHVVAYAISAGHIAEPRLRIAGKRVFSAADIDAIQEYFSNRTSKRTNGRK